jgi:hypothetical protein
MQGTKTKWSALIYNLRNTHLKIYIPVHINNCTIPNKVQVTGQVTETLHKIWTMICLKVIKNQTLSK